LLDSKFGQSGVIVLAHSEELNQLNGNTKLSGRAANVTSGKEDAQVPGIVFVSNFKHRILLANENHGA
jgi:hypothetical protein